MNPVLPGIKFEDLSHAWNQHAIIAATDPAGRIIFANPMFCSLSGYSEQELIGKTHGLLNSGVHPKSFFTDMWRTIASGRVWRGEICNRAKNRSLYWVETTIVPIFAPDGKISQYIAIRTDITNLKSIQESLQKQTSDLAEVKDLAEKQNIELAVAGQKLEEARRAAETAAESKSEFLANMSHEIRTPMTAILGFAELLDDPDLTAQQRAGHISTIRRNGEFLLDIINDILDLSKLEAGRMQVEKIDCNPQQVIGDVVELMNMRARGKGLELEMTSRGVIPAAFQTDPTRLRQILTNLVGNAIKFTERGKVSVVARWIDSQADSASGLQIEIADSGIGMTEEQMARLFQPFTQADASTTRRFGGTGLGLTISQRLARMLDGQITARSTPGQGSVFTLFLRGSSRATPTDPIPIAPHLHSKTDPAPATALTSLAGCRILVAEDGPDNQILIGIYLKKSGAEYHIVDNGRKAVQAVQASISDGKPFDLILMDVQMPELDGHSATRELRAAGVTIPILALTAHAMESDRIKCLEVGCNDMVTKPIDNKKLIACSLKAIGSRRCA